MHNLSIYNNYLCDSMQFSNAFANGIKICELCIEPNKTEVIEKHIELCVYFTISVSEFCAKNASATNTL